MLSIINPNITDKFFIPYRGVCYFKKATNVKKHYITKCKEFVKSGVLGCGGGTVQITSFW